MQWITIMNLRPCFIFTTNVFWTRRNYERGFFRTSLCKSKDALLRFNSLPEIKQNGLNFYFSILREKYKLNPFLFVSPENSRRAVNNNGATIKNPGVTVNIPPPPAPSTRDLAENVNAAPAPRYVNFITWK